MVGDHDYPAALLHRRQYRVPRQGGRIRLRQDELPIGWRIGGNRHDDCSVSDVNADLRLLRPFPAEGVEQRQGRRPATGRVHHQIGLQGLRASRPGIKPNTAHRSTTRCRYDPHYPALRPQRYVSDRLSPASQHELDQGPGRTQQRYAEIPLWQCADIRPLVLDVLCDLDGDSASSGKVTLEARENLAESLEATSQQTMWVPILGGAGPRSGGCRQAVALEDIDPLKVPCQGAGHRQPADASADHDRPTAQETAHAATSRSLEPADHRTQVTAEFQPEGNALRR